MAIANPIYRRRLLMLGPLAVAAGAGGAFLAMLMRMKDGQFDPRAVPNPLIGQRMPEFDLPAQIPATEGFSSRDVFAAGRPVLVNFFASWCVPCVVEAPVLMDLKEAGLPIWGIAYKDQAAAAATFLTRYGNPYQRLARDEPGRVAIDFGVYGVPETFIVKGDGTIAYKFIGPMSEESLRDTILPEIAKAAK